MIKQIDPETENRVGMTSETIWVYKLKKQHVENI